MADIMRSGERCSLLDRWGPKRHASAPQCPPHRKPCSVSVLGFSRVSEPMSISDILILTRGAVLQGHGRGELQQNGEKTMRIWLEHDPVAVALLLVGLATVELLAFII